MRSKNCRPNARKKLKGSLIIRPKTSQSRKNLPPHRALLHHRLTGRHRAGNAAAMRIGSLLLVAGIFLTLPVFAGPIDIQKIRVKGAQHIKDLRYFQETGLASQRHTAIDQQIEAFEKSLVAYREAKPGERNLALKQAQQVYERFQAEFKSIAEIFRDLVDKHQKLFNERNGEPYADTNTKEKTVATVEVGKQDESRALAAYNNRNYPYSAHLYLRSLRHYHQAFELRKWPPLVKLYTAPKKKPAKNTAEVISPLPAEKPLPKK